MLRNEKRRLFPCGLLFAGLAATGQTFEDDETPGKASLARTAKLGHLRCLYGETAVVNAGEGFSSKYKDVVDPGFNWPVSSPPISCPSELKHKHYSLPLWPP
jgi:hypothetical protein